jgi:hypothetical protein
VGREIVMSEFKVGDFVYYMYGGRDFPGIIVKTRNDYKTIFGVDFPFDDVEFLFERHNLNGELKSATGRWAKDIELKPRERKRQSIHE